MTMCHDITKNNTQRWKELKSQSSSLLTTVPPLRLVLVESRPLIDILLAILQSQLPSELL